MRYLTGSLNRILLATDFTESSQRAFDAAVRLARGVDATLEILHVHEERFFLRHSSKRDVDALLENLSAKRKVWLEKFRAAAHEAGVTASVHAREGIASETILEYAEEIDAGVLVLATTGVRGLKALLPGSTAKKVLKNARRPVLSVAPRADVQPCGKDGSFRHILYPTDLEEPDGGLAAAERLATLFKATLTLVHVQRVPQIPSMPGEPIVTLPRTISEPTRERLDALAGTVRDRLDREGVKVRTRLEMLPDVAEAIAEVAERDKVDLIVAPRHATTTLGKHVFGRTAERLSKVAAVPVLLFTPDPGRQPEG